MVYTFDKTIQSIFYTAIRFHKFRAFIYTHISFCLSPAELKRFRFRSQGKNFAENNKH